MSIIPYAPEASSAPWPELDRGLLQVGGRASPTPFPLEVIPDGWRPWIEEHAQASTCTDYSAQALLAAVSAACGSRIVVEVTPQWREPLVLWQALVGAPSTGKTAALAAGRRLLGRVTAPDDPPITEKNLPRGEPSLTPWMVHRGISSWYEELDAWLETLSRDRAERACIVARWTGDPSHSKDFPITVGTQGHRLPGSIFGTIQAGRLAGTLRGVDGALLSQLLYCWPALRLEARLEGVRADGVPALLQRLVDLPATMHAPATLSLSEEARAHLQDLMVRLRAFMRDSDELEAAWIGKGTGTIVRLAGLLGLMDWAEGDRTAPCTTVALRHLEWAHSLWNGYFWPHAQAVFGSSFAPLDESRVRRVGRWLRRMRRPTVSREDVRREALCQAVDADTAEQIIEQLESRGALRMLPVAKPSRGGPRKQRWEVNPALWAS